MSIFTAVVGAYLWSSGLAHSQQQGDSCADLSGEYKFLGKWEKNVGVATSGPPRFDEFALSIYAREVIDPHTALVKQELTSGTLNVELIGSGIDNQWKKYRPLLPAHIPLECIGQRWLREVTTSGKGGF